MTQPNLPLYPLRFEPIYKPKVWGGNAIATLGRALPQQAIGESWELVDIGQNIQPDGQSSQERSIVANGPLAGQSLHQLITRYGQQLLGKLSLTASGEFPLLVKFLDATENLSLQVHPSPAYTQTHPEAHLKNEAWYILAAKPGAAIYKGIKAGVTLHQLQHALQSNQTQNILDLLLRIPVKAGDCHYLPSGTCHALGGGILVAEIQTPSDTTYRLFDWGRTDRTLHIKQGLDNILLTSDTHQAYEQRSHVGGIFTTVSRLVSCEHFQIDKVRMSESYEQELPYDQPAVWVVLEGAGTIFSNNGAQPIDFHHGQTLLIPANMSDAKLKLHQDTAWLEVTFPQAMLR